MALITEFPYWLQVCTSLEKLFVEIRTAAGTVETSRRERLVNGLINRIYKKPGVKGIRVKNSPKRQEEIIQDAGAELYAWMASKALVGCSQELG